MLRRRSGGQSQIRARVSGVQARAGASGGQTGHDLRIDGQIRAYAGLHTIYFLYRVYERIFFGKYHEKAFADEQVMKP